MSLYQTDLSLPKLPIPTLSDTEEALGEMIRPLVDERVYTRTKRELNAFFAEGGPAQKLQCLLKEYQASLPGNASWLRPIWDDMYLSHRGRLPVDMNFSFAFHVARWGEHALPKLILALVKGIRRIGEAAFEPEAGKTGPVSMDMMQYMLYTRIPCRERDVLYRVPLNEPPVIAVTCNGNWFALSLSGKAGEDPSLDAINNALEEIRTLSQKKPGEPVGAFTGAGREDAGAIRAELSKHPLNRASLAIIEKSLFVLCLDPEDTPEDGSDIVCGDAANRWFDKSLQLIASGGRIGASFEHSGCDATIWLFLLSYVDSLIAGGKLDHAGTGNLEMRRLEWNISQTGREGLYAARAQFRELSLSLSFDRRILTRINKEAIKAAGCSPDAFVQILYQTAYLQLTGKIRSVYESVAVRNFYQGRTESLRPVSSESADFARAFLRGEEGSILKEKFRLALLAHSNKLSRAHKALGSERHMSGLLAMHHRYVGGALPGIFTCEGYKSLRNDALSTSSSTAPFIEFFGFGPVVTDGIGLGYGVKEDGLHIAVSAYPDSGVNPTEFLDTLDRIGTKLLEFLTKAE